MKTISIKRRDLAQAIAYRTHVDFEGDRWSWEVSFNPKAQEPEAHVLLVNPDVEQDVSYVFANEETFDPMHFVKLESDFRWGEAGTLPSDATRDGKEFETICIPDDILEQIEHSLLKHVEYDGVSYGVSYY